MAQHYRCNVCKKEFTSKDIQIDHISPVIDSVDGFVSWDVFIQRLFCEADNLQAVCHQCHLIKTQEERNRAKMHKMPKT